MRVVNLKASNFKRLVAVDITPDGNVVQITGKNGQGKTSVLDAVFAALAGPDAARRTPKPIRDGEKTAEVRVDLGEFVVTRRWTKDGPGTLTVESPNGARFPSPQKVLDDLLGRFAFDPLAFVTQSAREQRATLVEALGDSLGFDPVLLDQQRAAAYEQRTAVGRDVKRLIAERDALGGVPDGTPDVEVSVADLVNDLSAVEAARAEYADLVGRANAAQQNRERLAAEVEAVRRQLVAVEARFENAEAIESEFSSMVHAHEAEDPQPIRDRIAGADEINRAVRQKVAIAAAGERVAEAEAAWSKHDGEVKSIDETKRAGLARASFPVDGLGFDDDGVTFHGVPFGQASTSEQLRASVGIAMAMNPTLRVLRIDRAEALDSDGIRLLEEMAAAEDYQLWISRVDESGTVGIVIEEGQVADGNA